MRIHPLPKYIIYFSLTLLLFFLEHSAVFAARVAGEDGVTSVTSKSEQKVKPASKPEKVERPMSRTSGKNPISSKGRPVTKDLVIKNDNNSQQTGGNKSEARYVTIDFDDVDIAIFIKFISELTGKNFVIDKAVSGKITVISPSKTSVAEAYKVFESVLEVYGYAAVTAGNITKIVPAATAKSKNIETRLKKEAISPDDKIVTQLIPLKYANPSDLKKLFDPFISKSSLIVPYEPTATLIVTDVLSNIDRLLKIIKEIDVEGIGEEIVVIPLEFATASVLAKSLSTIFQKTGIRKVKGRTTVEIPIKITSDERTNSLIILAAEDDTQKVRQLVSLLDAEIPRGEGDIHVYYLQNASAEDLAAVMKAIPADSKDAAQKGKAPVISKDVQIVADKATNALIITANKSDYAALESVIKQLDIPRRMVYIEALIMEVSVTKNFDIGVEWYGGKRVGDYKGSSLGAFVGSTAGNSALPSDPLSLPPGFSLGVLGDTITIGGLEFPGISAIIKAYENDTDVHILSTPQIMTTDNEEAEITVADNIPYLTRQDTSETGTDYSNYDYKDVGTTLNITPQINQERFVRLKVSQEVSQVVSDAEQLPTTLKRVAKTTVIVKDGHTMVIGGLIDETLTQGASQVPCLGNMPGLGWLFKSFSKESDKTNLFIFITPHIVENPAEAEEVYKGKKEKIDAIREGVIKMYREKTNDQPSTTLDDE